MKNAIALRFKDAEFLNCGSLQKEGTMRPIAVMAVSIAREVDSFLTKSSFKVRRIRYEAFLFR